MVIDLGTTSRLFTLEASEIWVRFPALLRSFLTRIIYSAIAQR